VLVCRIAGIAGKDKVFAAGAADRCAASCSHVNFVFAVKEEDSCANTAKLSSRLSMHEGSSANGFGP
jgi:hypothetical protein